MPLLGGSSQSVISENIREMRNSGHDEAQAVAASLRNADKYKKPSKRKAKMKTMKPTAPGQKPITFKEGGLHASAGVAPGKKIPAAKHAAAKSGKLGPKAKKQEMFFENVLKH